MAAARVAELSPGMIDECKAILGQHGPLRRSFLRDVWVERKHGTKPEFKRLAPIEAFQRCPEFDVLFSVRGDTDPFIQLPGQKVESKALRSAPAASAAAVTRILRAFGGFTEMTLHCLKNECPSTPSLPVNWKGLDLLRTADGAPLVQLLPNPAMPRLTIVRLLPAGVAVAAALTADTDTLVARLQALLREMSSSSSCDERKQPQGHIWAAVMRRYEARYGKQVEYHRIYSLRSHPAFVVTRLDQTELPTSNSWSVALSAAAAATAPVAAQASPATSASSTSAPAVSTTATAAVVPSASSTALPAATAPTPIPVTITRPALSPPPPARSPAPPSAAPPSASTGTVASASASAAGPSFVSPVRREVAPTALLPSASGSFLVKSRAELSAFLAAAQNGRVVGVDCEGVNLSKTGRVTLVQAATANGSVFLFDLLEPSAEFRGECVAGLRAVLESKEILKVGHDLRQDSAALLQVNIRLSNCFDTSVAHSLLERIQAEAGSMGATGFPPVRHASLNLLLSEYKLSNNPYKRQVVSTLEQDPYIWQKRPMDPQLLRYAIEDVRQLVALAEKQLVALKNVATRHSDAASMNLFEVVKELSNLHLQVYRDGDEKGNGGIADLSGLSDAARRYLDVNWLTMMGFQVPTTLSSSGAICLAGDPAAAGSLPQVRSLALDNAESSNAAVDSLLALLPSQLSEAIKRHPRVSELVDIALDTGRPVRLGFRGDVRNEPLPAFHALAGAEEEKETKDFTGLVTAEMLEEVVSRGGLHFGQDNRASLPGCFHRISRILSRSGKLLGLTCRVGRPIEGMGAFLLDLVAKQKSILLLGKPGCGKTTIIRDFAREFGKVLNTIIVDTSCEIGGDGDVMHSSLGDVRRLQVPSLDLQQHIMVEAVQNHTPGAIVVDEIGREGEVLAARTIAQRGVILAASAHGYVRTLLRNPVLVSLMGGIEEVIIGDVEARNKGIDKLQRKRIEEPVFDIVCEHKGNGKDAEGEEWVEWAVYHSAANTVDAILAKQRYSVEVRRYWPRSGRLTVRLEWVKPEVEQGRRPVHLQYCRTTQALMGQGASSSGYKCPLTRADLLVAKHDLLDPCPNAAQGCTKEVRDHPQGVYPRHWYAREPWYDWELEDPTWEEASAMSMEAMRDFWWGPAVDPAAAAANGTGKAKIKSS